MSPGGAACVYAANHGLKHADTEVGSNFNDCNFEHANHVGLSVCSKLTPNLQLSSAALI